MENSVVNVDDIIETTNHFRCIDFSGSLFISAKGHEIDKRKI
jgi:hypothetical protein